MTNYRQTGKHWLYLTPAELLFAYDDSEYDKAPFGAAGKAKNYLGLRLTLYLFHDSVYSMSMYLFRRASPEQERQSNTNAFAMPTEEVLSTFDFADNSAGYDQMSQDIPIIGLIISKMLKIFFDNGDLKTIIPVDLDYPEPLTTHDTEIPEMANKSQAYEFRELGVMILLSLPHPPFTFENKKLVIGRAGRDPEYYQYITTHRDLQELSDYRDLQVNDPPPRYEKYQYTKVENRLKDTEGAKSLTPAFMGNAAKAFERYEQWLKDVGYAHRGFGGQYQ